MDQPVILSTARSPIGKAYRGALNDTSGATLGAHAISHALARSGVEAGRIEDVILGCGMPEATTGLNIARRAALLAGIPVTAAGATVDRQCASACRPLRSLVTPSARARSPRVLLAGLNR